MDKRTSYTRLQQVPGFWSATLRLNGSEHCERADDPSNRRSIRELFLAFEDVT